MEIQYVSFNQYGSHLTYATTSGFSIYALNPSLEKKIYKDDSGGVNVMKILHKSNIYVFSGAGSDPFKHKQIESSKNTLVLWDHDKQNILVKVDFSEQIKNFHIHASQKIVVVLEKKVIHLNFQGSVIDTRTTYSNPNGVCDMTVNDNATVVTLGSRKGEIDVWNLGSGTHKLIQAHNNNIQCLAVSKDGDMVATASEKGTLIRVFCMNSGKMLYEFRRGSQSSTVHSIAFNYNKDNSYKPSFLACSSSRNNSVHIFELYDKSKVNQNEVTTINTVSMFSGIKDYMPVGSEWVASKWSCKTHYLEGSSKTVCAFDERGALHVATYDGRYYKISDSNFSTISSTSLFVGSK